eukprot:COSAG05_NODE_559_length_8689_cov_212.699418_2_plen_84_part_00
MASARVKERPSVSPRVFFESSLTAHQGSMDVDGPSVITLASPLVCDSQTGACLNMPPALVAAGVTVEQFVVGLATEPQNLAKF